MTLPRLDNLVSIGQLKTEPPEATEIAGHLASGTRRLEDARNVRLHIESRFDLAYNAAHSLALAALRVHGYRSDNRYLVFQTLQDTVQLPSTKWRVLDQAHKKRNLVEYGGSSTIEVALVEELVRVASELEALVVALVQSTNE